VERLLRIAPWRQTGAPDDAGAERVADQRLVAGLRARQPWAVGALCERYGDHVRRVLLRVLGGDDAEHADLVQEVLVHAWRGIGELRAPGALKAWLTHIAVFRARAAIRKRRRRRWLAFFGELPEVEAAWATGEVREAARAVYAIFERMPEDERIPFALRMLEGMSLEETAAACGMPLGTLRRRLVRGERRFFKLARDYESLAPWLRAQGGRAGGDAGGGADLVDGDAIGGADGIDGAAGGDGQGGRDGEGGHG
jgi:RNA polymerase sigma-70 factor (ECF subfamily)